MNNNIIYKRAALWLCNKNIDKGLSFSNVSVLKDAHEFDFTFEDSTKQEIVSWIRNFHKENGGCSNLDKVIELMNEHQLKKYAECLFSDEAKEEWRASIRKRYAICCFTDDKNASWTDKPDKELVVIMCFEAQKLQENTNLIFQRVNYVESLPRLNVCKDLLKQVNKIVFTKLKSMSNERELRAVLRTEIVDDKIMKICYSKEDDKFFYGKFLHDCLSEIQIPKEMYISSSYRDEIRKLDDSIRAPQDVESQIESCETFIRLIESEGGVFHALQRLKYVNKFQEEEDFSLAKARLTLKSRHHTEIMINLLLALDDERKISKKIKTLLATPRFSHTSIVIV